MTTLVFSNAFIFTTALKGYFLNLINPILVCVGQYVPLFICLFCTCHVCCGTFWCLFTEKSNLCVTVTLNTTSYILHFFLSGTLHRRLDKLPMSMSIMALNPTLPMTWPQTTWTSWGWSSACVRWWWESNGQLGLQSTVLAFRLPTPNSMMIPSKSCLVLCCPFRQLLCLTCKIPLLCLYQERVSQSYLLVKINCYFCNQDPAYGVDLAWNVVLDFVDVILLKKTLNLATSSLQSGKMPAEARDFECKTVGW